MLSKLANQFQKRSDDIWTLVNEIVEREKPVDLGMGSPDYLTSSKITQHLADIHSEADPMLHQYTRSSGHERLVHALSALYKQDFGGRIVDPLNEILVSVGAYGSLFTAISALIDPGDEAIVIEPFFSCYVSMIRKCGGIPRTLPLRYHSKQPENQFKSSSNFYLDMNELEALANARTKLIILNSPNNPSGKVMQIDELRQIADFCIRHDLICVSDEVYEFLVYEPNRHIKIASLPHMWKRTLTIGSAGKSLSVTGWRLGWTIGPAYLISGMQIVHRNHILDCATPLQEAVARTIEEEISLIGTSQSYWTQLRQDWSSKRDRMAQILSEIGLTPIIPEGGYFIMVDISNFDFPIDPKFKSRPRDFQFNLWMIQNKKIAAIPNSTFHTQDFINLGEKYIRICFTKFDETIEKALKILEEWNVSEKTKVQVNN